MLGISPTDIVLEDKGASSEADGSSDNNNLYQGKDDWNDLCYDDWFSEDSV